MVEVVKRLKALEGYTDKFVTTKLETGFESQFRSLCFRNVAEGLSFMSFDGAFQRDTVVHFTVPKR